MEGAEKTIVYAFAAACILGIIIVGALVLTSHTSEGFSELYFANPDELPRLVDLGDNVKFEFIVVSHETNRSYYKYNVSYDGRIIKSGFFALMPEKRAETSPNSNKETIMVNLIPNISSLVKIVSPKVELSRFRSNASFVIVSSQGTGIEDGNIVVTPNSNHILFFGKNDTTRQMHINLPDKRIIPIDLQLSALSTQKGLFMFDPAKKESYATNDSRLEQLGDSSNPNLNISNSLSDFGYIVRKDEWSINSDHGILDILRRKIETKYLYEFKKVAVQVYSSDSQSNYDIHFWIVVKESPNKLLSL
jgi:hypothetical protein